MKRQIPYIIFASCICTHFVTAQKAIFLAPQQHKLLYADTVYREAIAKRDSLLLAEAYYLYGKTYLATGNILLSNQWYYKSLRILEPRGDSREVSRLYLRLAVNAYNQANYTECLRLNRMGVAMAERINNPKNLLLAYGNMTALFERDWSDNGKNPLLPKPQLDSCLYYIQKSVITAQKTGDQELIVEINMWMASYKWRHFRDTSKLFESFDMAMNYYTERKWDGLLMSVKIEFANILLDMNRPKAALVQINEARQIYDRNPFNDLYKLGRIQDTYSRYYQLTGNWKKAYEINERTHQLQISNYIADRDGAVSRLDTEYNMEKKDILLRAKDTELSLRDSTLAAQRRFLIVSFMLLVVTAGMSLVFYRLNKKNQLISHQNALLVKEQSHRVKNDLQAVSSLLGLQGNELTDPGAHRAIEESRLRIQAIGIVHRKLYDSKQLAMVYVPGFLKELTASLLSVYGFDMQIATLRMDKIHLSSRQAVHLGLIVNEVITNACKYAFANNDSPQLSIRCRKLVKHNKTYLFLEIADNGPEMSLNSPWQPRSTGQWFTNTIAPAGTGLGMKLIQVQTRQLRAESAFSYDNGTIFTINFAVDERIEQS